MSHPEQHFFISQIKEKFPSNFYDKHVLEFGSCYINGTVRTHFTDCLYIGLDIGPGTYVDVVGLAHEYNLPDETFDTVLSCEMFEHDLYWDKSFANMIRLCKKQGLIIFTCATTGRKEHGTFYNKPNESFNTLNYGWDYYKNLSEIDFRQKFDCDSIFSEYEFSVNKISFDLYFYGIKV